MTFPKDLTKFGMMEGVEGELLSLLQNFATFATPNLKNREQRVVLNGRICRWRKVNSGVPEGSVLGPLKFLIYINDLPDGIFSMCKFFTDDTSLFLKSPRHK